MWNCNQQDRISVAANNLQNFLYKKEKEVINKSLKCNITKLEKLFKIMIIVQDTILHFFKLRCNLEIMIQSQFLPVAIKGKASIYKRETEIMGET